jgi:hypothetical protein
LERGVRPIGDWSNVDDFVEVITGPRCRRALPVPHGRGAGACAAAAYKVSLTKVDLPEPDTPVTQVSRPTGNATVTLRRLWPLAPWMVMALLGLGVPRGPRQRTEHVFDWRSLRRCWAFDRAKGDAAVGTSMRNARQIAARQRVGVGLDFVPACLAP